MSEKLSALLDDELSPEEARIQLDCMFIDDSVCAEWEAYSLIGDAIRGELGFGNSNRAVQRLIEEDDASPPPGLFTVNRGWGRFALAGASMAVACGLIAWSILGRGVSSPEERDLQGIAAVNMSSMPVESPTRTEPTVVNYIMAHQQFSPSNALQGVAPYVRLVSEDADGRDR